MERQLAEDHANVKQSVEIVSGFGANPPTICLVGNLPRHNRLIEQNGRYTERFGWADVCTTRVIQRKWLILLRRNSLDRGVVAYQTVWPSGSPLIKLRTRT